MTKPSRLQPWRERAERLIADHVIAIDTTLAPLQAQAELMQLVQAAPIRLYEGELPQARFLWVNGGLRIETRYRERRGRVSKTVYRARLEPHADGTRVRVVLLSWLQKLTLAIVGLAIPASIAVAIVLEDQALIWATVVAIVLAALSLYGARNPALDRLFERNLRIALRVPLEGEG